MSTIQVELYEWQSHIPEAGSPLENVFIDEPNDQMIAKMLTDSGKLLITEHRRSIAIEATSYVGSITLGNINITIKPKINGTPLLSLLRYAYSLRNLDLLSTTEISLKADTFQDIIVYQLITEIRELISRGLIRKYISQREYLSNPKGKIDIQQIAKTRNISETTLPCIHFPRLYNCLFNQVLLEGLLYASKITDSIGLKTACREQAMILMDNVSRIRLDRETLKRLHERNDRLTTAYKPAITLIDILLESKGISLIQKDDRIELPGFLFDMNRFFQTLISRFLSDNLAGYSIIDEYRLKGMLSYVPGFNPVNRRSPEPRPDYIIQQDSNILAVLDAKYRDLFVKSLPREMLYQLSIYALSQISGGEAVILYPALSDAIQEARIEISEPLHGIRKGMVILRPINLLSLNNLINMRGVEGKRKRFELASIIAFGKSKLHKEYA